MCRVRGDSNNVIEHLLFCVCVYSVSINSLCFSLSQEQSCLSRRTAQSSNFHKHISHTNCQKSLPPWPCLPSFLFLLNPRTFVLFSLSPPPQFASTPSTSAAWPARRHLASKPTSSPRKTPRCVQLECGSVGTLSSSTLGGASHEGVRRSHGIKTNSICRRACLISGMRPSEAALLCFVFALLYCLCSLMCFLLFHPPSCSLPLPGSAGNASFLGGGELPHQVRQVPQNREVLPGPDRAPLRVVSNHGKPPPEERQPPPHYIPTVSWV